MTVRNAEFVDMKRLGHIMSVSFRTAFSDFVKPETMDACAQEDNCIALLEGIYQKGQVHFLIGGDSGMLCWQSVGLDAEIVAIHSLPESWGTGLGSAMLSEAMNQIGERTVFYGHLRRINAPADSMRSMASAGMARNGSANLTAHWKRGM